MTGSRGSEIEGIGMAGAVFTLDDVIAVDVDEDDVTPKSGRTMTRQVYDPYWLDWPPEVAEKQGMWNEWYDLFGAEANAKSVLTNGYNRC